MDTHTPKSSPVAAAMHKVRRRMALQRLVDCTITCLFAATVLSCLWLLASRAFPVLWDAAYIFGASWGVAVLAAGVWAWRRRPGLIDAALAADQRLGLKERFTSSLALQPEGSPMVEAVQRDAQHHLGRLNVRRDFPLSPARSLRYFAVPILLFGLGYMLLPEMDLFGYQERALEAKAQATAIESKASSLKNTAKLIKPAEDSPEAPLDSLALDLEQVALSLERQEITEMQALARVSNLARDLQEQREQLKKQSEAPQLNGDPSLLGAAKDLAKSLQNGDFGDASKKLKELQQKLSEGKLSEGEKASLAKDIQALQQMMQGEQTVLSDALAAALAALSEGLESGDMAGTTEAFAAMELSLEELAAILEHLAKMENALQQLSEYKMASLGPSKFCRSCGKKLKPCEKGGDCKSACEGGECSGSCSATACVGNSNGLYAGNAQGIRTGTRDEMDTEFETSILPGQMRKGKMLATMMQKAVPRGDAEAQVEMTGGTFEMVQQEAEQALTKEEIPRASKEFVRQYFGTLDPAPEAAAGTGQ